MMGPVGGSGGWLSEKQLKKNFVPNELKSPDINMSFFVLSIFGGWVGWFRPKYGYIHIFVCFFIEPFPYTNQ